MAVASSHTRLCGTHAGGTTHFRQLSPSQSVSPSTTQSDTRGLLAVGRRRSRFNTTDIVISQVIIIAVSQTVIAGQLHIHSAYALRVATIHCTHTFAHCHIHSHSLLHQSLLNCITQHLQHYTLLDWGWVQGSHVDTDYEWFSDNALSRSDAARCARHTAGVG